MVIYLPLGLEPGRTFGVAVGARPDPATGRAITPGYNQRALDPVTGAVTGIVIWARKRAARVKTARGRSAARGRPLHPLGDRPATSGE